MAGRIEIGSFKVSWGTEKKSSSNWTLKGEPPSYILGEDTYANEKVTEKRAHGLATVFTCINVRARTIASLPLNVMIEEGGDKRVLTDHPAYYILAHQPNKYMSSANMFLTSMIHSDSWGNSVIGINRDSRLRPSSFDLICPGEWNVVKQDGEAWYKINGEVYPSRDVLHFRWFSYDGLEGVSPIRLNANTMGMGFKQDRYAAMALGKKPPGVLSYEGEIKQEFRAQNQKTWHEDIESGRTPILSGKYTYQPIMIPPHDAEYVMSRKLTKQEIYGIYQLPPTFAQDYERATWSNAEQADLVYVKHTVTNICRVIEQECNMKLFTEREKKNMFTKFNINGLMRGDMQARAAFYTAMRNIGGLNGNEIRSYEDMNAYDGGEIYTVQGANIPIDQLRDFYTKEVEPSAQNQPEKSKINGYHHVN